LREFEELLQEEAEEERTEGEEEEVDDDLVEGVQDIELTGEEDEEGDFFGGERRMKEWERENVKRCLVALGHCGEMIKRVLDTVDEAMTEEGGEGGEGGREEGQEEGERIQKVAEVEESCQGLAAAVVNAADALYPPQVGKGGREGGSIGSLSICVFKRDTKVCIWAGPSHLHFLLSSSPLLDTARARIATRHTGGRSSAHSSSSGPVPCGLGF